MNGDIRGVLARLVQTEGKAFYGDADRVEARLQEQASDHPRETAVLVTAVRAGVIDELLGVSPGLFNIAVGHLAGRMVRLHGADAAASRWAVETWADALGVTPASSAVAPPPAAAPTPPTEPVVAPESLPVEPRPSKERPAPAKPPLWRLLERPGAAAIGVGVVGLVALIVLVRLIAGVVHGSGGDESDASHAAVPTSTPATSARPGPSPALTVPPDLALGTGDVQATLIWADGGDLDLHVVDPRGTEIYFSNPRSPSGGTLDHDDTAGCTTSGTHVENVFWPSGGAPAGSYRVFAKKYSSCGSPSQYTLRVTVGGRVILDSTATLPATEGAESAPFTFTK